jgi:hypothetical protein
MEPLHEALRLIKRQTELENAMRRPGGIRVTEERELYGVTSRFGSSRTPRRDKRLISQLSEVSAILDSICNAPGDASA